MKQLLICAAFAVLAAVSPAAAEETAMPLQLQQGAHYTVTIEQTQSTTLSGESFSADISSVTALDILSVSPGDARWRYTPVSYTIKSASGPGMEQLSGDAAELGFASDMLSAAMRIVADVGFECRVDDVGRCVELANWPLWRDRMENTALMIDAAVQLGVREAGKQAAGAEPEAQAAPHKKGRHEQNAPEHAGAAPGASAPDWQRFRQPILQGFASVIDGLDARSAASLMASFHPPAAVQGRSLTRGQAVAFVEDWPMPFAAQSVRMTGTLTLDRIDRRAGTATVTRRARLDSASAQAALRGMTSYIVSSVIEPFAPLMAEHGQNAPSAEMIHAIAEAALSVLQADMTETTTGTIELSTGLARQTVTDMRIQLSMPENGQTRMLMDSTLHSTIRITPGAPAAPRLPRAPHT
jgi:hypothetical protein